MSSSAPAHLRRKRLIVAGASAVALLAVAVIGHRSAEVTIPPGTVVFDVQASEIDALGYLSGDAVLKARRIAPAGPFSIEASHAGTLAKCQSSLDLSGLLPQVARIKAEPIPPFSVRTRSDRSAIALVYDKVAVETDMVPDLFTKLGAGCSALSMK
jgi:hypothetical protein